MDVYDPARFGFPEGSLVYDCAKDVRDEIVQASQRIRGQPPLNVSGIEC